ncbi:MAG: hypothetical protein EZS28_049849, partial [Streblomastix strix]
DSSVCGSESVSYTRKDESFKSDKHATGEELFRKMVGRVWIDGAAVNNVIESSKKNMDLNEAFKARPNVILSNALTWREKKRGK